MQHELMESRHMGGQEQLEQVVVCRCRCLETGTAEDLVERRIGARDGTSAAAGQDA